MRFTSLLFLVLATALPLPALAGGEADPLFAEQPIKQALAGPTELEAPLQLQTSTEILGAPAKESPASPADESADLWARIRAGFTLQDIDSPLVQTNIDWYANRPDYVRRMIDRSQLYLFHIVDEVEKRGMPTEIALLPMIESAFNPKAYSRSHASGIWQFIPSTGKNFGLEQNWWHDDRRNITAATDAALDYLQKLHNMFGSWELALAAYNWGEGSVQRAIAKNEKKGLPTDYFSLKMPDETRNYLPKLMAVKQIVMDPAAHNVELASIPNRPYFSSVITTQHIDLAVAARLAGMPLHEFVSLNPAYNRPVINAKGSRALLLPVDKADTFASNLESYDKPLASWKSYTLSRGDKLDSVARKFSTSVAHLKEINGISKRYRLAVGQTLLVPLGAGNEGAALIFNDVRPVVESEEPAQSSALSRLVHGVRKGETLADIAKRYKVSAAQIRSLNNLKTSRLSRGMKLVIRQEAASGKRTVAARKATAAKPVAVARNRGQRYYTVRRGDTLFSIARRFNVAVNDIQRWNNFSAKHGLMPGNKVTLSP
ncbi:MAG: LysM peptidoglycan-binding domain-containing protein [Sulfuricella sp.]|nr:LysM peptidoglycan-binding domain-containing protein [Sulfuricella sp.]